MLWEAPFICPTLAIFLQAALTVSEQLIFVQNSADGFAAYGGAIQVDAGIDVVDDLEPLSR